MRFSWRTGSSDRKHVRRRVPSAPQRQPRITAVVTAHNYGRYLSACVHSALSQQGVAVRTVIVDDCSHDETPAVTSDLGRDPRVVVVRNVSNQGLERSFNIGLARVDSEYVVKLDADDLLAPGALARAAALLEACPQVGFVYGRPRHFTDQVPELSYAATRSWTIWSGHDWVTCRCRSGANVISQPEVVMRTAAVREVGGLSVKSPPQTSDMNLWLQLASIGSVGRINGPIQGLYRVHEASMSRTTHAGVVCDLEGRRGAFAAALELAAGNLPDARELNELANRSLAVTALDYACRAYDRGQTGEKPVDDLVAFALDTYVETRQLREWAALQRRRSVGAERAPRHPQFFADALTRRLSEELGHWHWLRTGEL